MARKKAYVLAAAFLAWLSTRRFAEANASSETSAGAAAPEGRRSRSEPAAYRRRIVTDDE